MKKILLILVNFISFFWRLIPSKLRRIFITGIFLLESRGNVNNGLRKLFLIKDNLDWVINERALFFGNGKHPKHILTKYHDFFSDHIVDGKNILDIGCGYGAVAKTLAENKPNSNVIGIDYDPVKLLQAKKIIGLNNLKFISLDATKSLPDGIWDVIILSNVLEHIQSRVFFLKQIVKNSKCETILIRVPLFERSWEIPMRKELGVNYYSDNDHKIEHTLIQFKKEMAESNLQIKTMHTIWGEIWAVCSVKLN